MGWKPGQGVGPRVTKHEKKRISQVRSKVYGCSLQNENREEDESDSDTDDDEALKNITFAPNDFPFQMVKPKENFFGLGYVGLDRKSVLSVPTANPNIQSINKKGITGLGFGVGALEEEDEDIYSKEDMSQYDFALGGNEENKNSASDEVTGDLYDIFILGLKIKDTIFNPPILPGRPKPGEKPKRFEPIPDTRKSKEHSPSPERKTLPEEREDLQKQARAITEGLTVQTKVHFQPFIFDSGKKARYEKYINLLAKGRPEDLATLQPLNMTEWEREKERIEFEQANKLFQPLSTSMESRFVTEVENEECGDPLPPVDRMKYGTEEEIKAAKLNFYGRLTRTVEDWIPCSLLCKRFNIREKDKDELLVPKSKAKHSIFDDFMISLHPAAKSQTQQENIDVSSQPPETDDNTNESNNSEFDNLPENKIDLFNAIFLDTDSDDDDGNKSHNKTDQSGPMSKEVTEMDKIESDNDKNMEMLYEDPVINEQRNNSPARGIFENLNYDLLTSQAPKNEDPKFENNDEIPGPSGLAAAPCSEVKHEEMELDMVYGPKLPETLPQRNTSFVPYTADCKNWVEKSLSRKHKKDRKHKKSKYKSKYKSKHQSSPYSHRHR